MVGNEGFADAESGGAVQKSETGGDPLALEIIEGVLDEKNGHQNDEAYDDHLKEQGPPGWIVPDGRFRRRSGGGHGEWVRIRGHAFLPRDISLSEVTPGPVYYRARDRFGQGHELQ